MPAVVFRSVSKSYPIYRRPLDRLAELATFHRLKLHRDFWALEGVSFEVGRGDVFCLLGENGSGKSTTLQLAARIFPPTAGEIETSGRISALLELGAGFNPEFSGRDNVYLAGTVLGLSTAEIRRRYSEIEQCAEIGDVLHQPVKTYSSGMLVRLAFAVAINVEPEILLVDEALAVGDYYFRQRCLRKVHELRRRGVTILFVSHAMADVKAIGTRALWLERGRVVDEGPPDSVVRKYLGAMAAKDAAYRTRRHEAEPEERPPQLAPEVVESIPNVDHRHGNGAAEIIGVAAFDERGRPLGLMEPQQRMVLRVSVRARRRLESPNVGFMLRNHLGLDFAGSNTDREGVRLPPMAPGDVVTVDFHLSGLRVEIADGDPSDLGVVLLGQDHRQPRGELAVTTRDLGSVLAE